MSYEKKEGDMILFQNTKKKTERDPDYTGNALVGGIEMRVAAWVRTDKNGNTYLSGRIDNAREYQKNHPRPASYQPAPLSPARLNPPPPQQPAPPSYQPPRTSLPPLPGRPAQAQAAHTAIDDVPF